MLNRKYPNEIVVFDAVSATGTSDPISGLFDYRNVMLTLSSANSANFTIKFQVSYSDTAPDFSAAASPTNRWDYVNVVDLEDKTNYDWDTGVVFTGTDQVRQFEIDTNGFTWFAATITARSAGDISLHLNAFTNQ